jgi:hypothetical protein
MNTSLSQPKFSLNQIVRGIRAGTFVVIGRKLEGGEWHCFLKEVHPVTFDRPQRGGICLPESAIREVA